MQQRSVGLGDRITGLDTARGLAVLAMIAVWLLPSGEHIGTDPSTWHLALSGRVLVLFALIAGVSMGLLNGGAERHHGVMATQDRVRLMVRAIGVFTVGHVLNMFEMPFLNTLSIFGVMIALGIAFLRFSPRTLLLVAAGWIALLPVLVTTWGWMSGFTWFSAFSPLGSLLFYDDPAVMRLLPVVLIGVALSRTNLRKREVQQRILAFGLLTVLVMGGAILPGAQTLDSAFNGADDRPLSTGQRPMDVLPEDTKKSYKGEAKIVDDASLMVPPAAEQSEEIDLTGKTCVLMDGVFIECYGSEEEAFEMKQAMAELMLGSKEAPPLDEGMEERGWVDSWNREGGWSGYQQIVTELGISLGVAMLVLGGALLLGSRLSGVAALGTMPVTAYASIILIAKAVTLPLSGWWVIAVLVASLVVANGWKALVGRGPVEWAIHAISVKAASIDNPSTDGVRSTDRILGLDVARGIALLGMSMVHLVTGIPFLSWNPDTWAGVASGRSSILFAVLAGISMAIMSGRNHPYGGEKLMQARSRILTRALIIFAIGLFLGTFVHPVAVILDYYGIFFVIALPFLTWKPKRLFATAAILSLIVPFVNYYINDWGAIGAGDALYSYLFAGVYPAFVWLALMLFGLGLGRLNLGELKVQQRLLMVSVLMVVVGWGAGEWAEHATGNQELQEQIMDTMAQLINADESSMNVSIIEGESIDQDEWSCSSYAPGQVSCMSTGLQAKFDETLDGGLWMSLGTWSPHSGTTFELIGSGGFALSVISLCLLLSRKFALLLTPLSAIGTAALTAYVAHVLMLAFWKDTPDGQWDMWLVFVGIAIPAAMLWKHFLSRGPIERGISWVAHRNSSIQA